ncbi:hypothetical protein K2X96_03340, partial [Patescibacteria group bacterium]|nr:hypothetical protein [Patescibacteria group bacterium]
PNIAGDQATIPAGMIKDTAGNCVTPPVDVCPNIAGDQATIPAGMIKDTAGNCVTPPVTVPLCDSFSLSPSTITSAQDVTLTWATTNADSVSISGGVGAVAVDGSVTRLVSEDTTFVLTATKGTQTATCQAAVDFNPVSNPVLSCDAFSINPSSVDRGNTATMSWNTTNADSVSIDNGIGSVSGDGTRDITVNEDRTYTLTATRGAQTITCTAPVSVNSDGGGGGGGGSSSPRCIDFDASDTRIQAGESVELSWRTTRGDRLVIERDVFSTRDDDEVDRGSVIVKPTKDTKYTLTVYRGSRKDTCTTEIRVDDITTITTRDQEPLTSISFTNIPYTGFDAGPFLTSVFYTLLALWSLAVAYVLVIKRGSVLGFSLPFAQPVMGGHGTLMPHNEFVAHHEARAHAHVTPAVFAPVAHTSHAHVAPTHAVPENLPTIGYAQHVASKEVAHEVVAPAGERTTIAYLEDAAHAHNVLLSSDALRAIIDQGETLHDNETLLTEVIARAKGAYPREDGWIILNRERVTALFADEESEEDTEVEEVSTPVHVEGSSTLAEAIVTSNTTLAYQKLGESPIFALADAAEALDAVVRARRGAGSASDMLMRAAAGVTDEKLKNAVVALTSAIDGTYDDESAAIRLAIIKALKAVA